MMTLIGARRLLLFGAIAIVGIAGTASAGESLASMLGFNDDKESCTAASCSPFGQPGAETESCTPGAECVHEGTSRSTVEVCWIDKMNWFGKSKHEAGCCEQGVQNAACVDPPSEVSCCQVGCTTGPHCDPANGHACCINQTGSCADGTCTCRGCQSGTGCLCCGTGRYAQSGCKCGANCRCGKGVHSGLFGKMFGTRAANCPCGPGCRCGQGTGSSGRFLADINGDGRADYVGKGRCRHCGRYGRLYGRRHCGLCCGIPIPGFLAGGHGGAIGGSYARVYAVNPYYHDFRDGAVYAATGYNAPISVPLAPNVDYQWNYGWGIPSSRLTPVSRVVPSPYAVQPTYTVPAGYVPATGTTNAEQE